MKYKKIVQGEFLERPNRFIAQVKIDNKIETVHVKNTGRCRELLTPNALVYLEDCEKPERKTRYDLVAVMKGNRLINMDSQAPNGAVLEWLKRADFFTDVTKIKPETKYGNSRFDFYIEAGGRKIFMEVKGVTLENDNVVSFPDAPSERAIKHIEELVEAVGEGYDAYICFVIQMKDVDYFKPNGKTQPAFVEALQKASKAGVHIIAFDCQVTQDAMHIRKPVEVRLYEDEILHQMVDPLLKWYEKGHRELPWRTDPTPYHVWISEIMLQQTRVEAVKPYYHRFMEALPTIEALATVEEDKLLKLWEGLGYYNRARNLQKAAIQIVEQHQGNMPNHYQALLSLPGIGTYTAGAIASIAYGEAVPAVDGNVLRVISRLRMDGEDILQGKVKKRVEEELIEVIPKEQSGNFNQALMELGATVCIPNGVPKCDCCPWEKICLAHRENVISEYPVKTKKKARTIEKKTILLIEDNDKIV
ncbi:MAG: A/G-specific adenine glycosylase, partial [Eubacteriales bacterium]